jgi:hypothetical protein
MRSRSPRLGLRARACGCLVSLGLGFALAGCTDTLQDRPIPHDTLETLLAAPFPVFWLGRSFHGLQITEALRDPGGAFTVQYGDCKQGGQGSCVPPLRVVTSPDNSFIPGGAARRKLVTIRGVQASLTSAGRSIVIATTGVVVGIYALDAKLAAAAADTVVPINESGWPGAALAPAKPDTGFASSPLPTQLPAPLAPPTTAAAGARRSSCASRHTCGRRRH